MKVLTHSLGLIVLALAIAVTALGAGAGAASADTCISIPNPITGGGSICVPDPSTTATGNVDQTCQMHPDLCTKPDPCDTIGSCTSHIPKPNDPGCFVANPPCGGPSGGGTTDTDGDGVPDSKDNCPSTPGVAPDGCPPKPADADNDGVADNADKCPGTKAGASVDASGCSPDQLKPPDADGDGVPDSADTCPGTAPGAAVDAHGCSAAQQHNNGGQTVIVRPVQPDVDVHVTAPNTTPVAAPSQPVIVNSPSPTQGSSSGQALPVIITTPAPNPTPAPAGPPVINLTLPSQPHEHTAPVHHVVHHTRRHRPVRHHRRSHRRTRRPR